MTKYGWLVFNGNYNNKNLLELVDFYKQTSKDYNIKLSLVKNCDLLFIMKNNKCFLKTKNELKNPDFILFLDKDINLARSLEILGYKVFNSSRVLNICDDKILSYQYILENKKINMPKTLISPFIFNIAKESESETENLINLIESEFNYPLVVKEAVGSFGNQVYLIKNRVELKKKRVELGFTPHLYQEFVKSSFGRDLRVHIIGNEFICCMLRHSDKDFRSNVNAGANFSLFEPKKEFIEMAIEVSKTLNSDFIGVDILFGENEEPIFCEVNSNANVKNISKLTGINVAGEVLKYIIDKV